MLLLFSALAPPCDPRHPVLLNSPSMPSLKRGKGGIGVGELFFVEGNGNNNGTNQAAQHRYTSLQLQWRGTLFAKCYHSYKTNCVFCCFTVLFFGQTLVTIIALEYVSLVFGYLIDPVHKLVETLSCNLSKCIPDR